MSSEGNEAEALFVPAKAKKDLQRLGMEDKQTKKPKVGKAVLHAPQTEKGSDLRNQEVPEFEYEYLQEKLYLEEIFNTFYLSFDNPAQVPAGNMVATGKAANDAQYTKLRQQEKNLFEELQAKPMQAGMGFEEQSEAALLEQLEKETPMGVMPPGLKPKETAGLALKAKMLQNPKENKEEPLSTPTSETLLQMKKDEIENSIPIDQLEGIKEEMKEKAVTAKPIEPEEKGKKKKEFTVPKQGKGTATSTQMLRSIYLSFPLKKQNKIGQALAIPPTKSGVTTSNMKTGPMSASPEGKTNIVEKEFKNGSYYKGEWNKGQPNGEGMLISCVGFVYQGKFLNGKFHGYGDKQMPNGVLYKGYWNNGQMEGKAKLTFPDGDIYLGSFKDNKFEGEGIRRFPNGDMYRGQYNDGYQHGYGIFISMEEGWKYIGQWNKGKIHGKGLCIWIDGTVYEGEWANWIKDGTGVLELSDKTSYKGEFKHDFPNGKGIKTFPDGSEYEGEFQNGQFNGHGSFRWSDGTVYEGRWQNNKISGEGTKTLQDGTTISGFFIGKKELSGKGTKTWTKNEKAYIYKGSIINCTIEGYGEYIFPDGRVYTGECTNGMMQGNGKYTWIDNNNGTASYSGDFSGNLFNGKGVIVWSNGDKYIGEFKEGTYEGVGNLVVESKKYHYNGQMKNGKAHGKGKLQTEYMSYEGQFVDGELEGNGQATFTTGDVYNGEFSKSKFNGYGRYIYVEGLEIHGFFVNGKCAKYGKKVFPDGRKYIGEINYDVPHGRGVMVKSNGNARYGRWEKGIYQKGESDPLKAVPKEDDQENEEGTCLKEDKESSKHKEVEPLSFPVYCRDGGLFDGLAEVEYANGEIYIGCLKNGLRDGEGEYRKEGKRFKGIWKANELQDNPELQIDDFNVPVSVKILTAEAAHST